MTDDIVTRLQCFTCEELNCESDVICREAADEIERLRNDLAEARHEYQKLWDRTSPDYILRKLQDD